MINRILPESQLWPVGSMGQSLKTAIFRLVLFFGIASSLHALPVSLGSIVIGLESFDGYQEGMAWLSTDEDADSLEILISYKGFGLDEVVWLFPDNGLALVGDAAVKAEWWRSQLLEMEVNQSVLKDTAKVNPSITYRHHKGSFSFEDAESVIRFVRQGRDYALLIVELLPKGSTRNAGNRHLPVFTLHFSREVILELSTMLSENNVKKTIDDFTQQRRAIESILSSSP